MNERIKELVLIAKHYANSDIFAENDVQLWQARYNEKFAELILQECKLFCGHDSEGVSAMFKHFGVEE